MDQNDQTLEELQRTGGAIRTPASEDVQRRGQQYAAAAQAMERQPAAAPPDVSGAYEARARSIEAAGERKGQIEGQIAGQAAAQQRDIQQQFEPQFKKTPEFQAPKEEGAQIAGAVAMLGAIAAFAGGKSYGNALMAMNAMSGMLNGYREGRKEVFDKAKIEYEKNVQAIKAHNDQITAAYNRALKAAPANLTAATSQLRQELSALDAKMQAEAVRTQGIEKAASTWNQARQQEQSLAQLQAVQRRHEENLQQRQAEMQQRGEIAQQRTQGRTEREVPPTGAERKAITGLQGYIKNIDNLMNALADPAFAKKMDKYRWQNMFSEEGGKVAAQIMNKNIPEDVRKFVIATNAIRNAYYLDISGKAVTASEAMRSYNVVPQPGDPASVLKTKFDVLKDKFVSDYEAYARTYPRYTERYSGERAAPQAPASTSSAPTSASAPVRVNSPEEARKLPSGTLIELPDGRQGRVP